MDTTSDPASTIIQMAIAYGLVDDLMREITDQSDILDLVNRLLLADAICSNEAVALIQAVTWGDGDTNRGMA